MTETNAYYLHFPNGNVLEDVDIYVLHSDIYRHVDTLPFSTFLARVNRLKEPKPELLLLRIQVGGIAESGNFI